MNAATVHLESDEAIVWFGFLSRYADECQRLEIMDSSEKVVLWNILAQWEKQLVEPSMPDYADRLEKARAAVRNGTGG